MGRKNRVVIYGLGPIGIETARLALDRPGIELAGAVDINPALVGKDLGKVLGLRRRLGVRVVDSPEAALKRKVDVVVHCAGSHMPAIYHHLATAVERKANVVSSAEELLFPSLQHPALARKLDRLARSKGVSILGTGVNPGFVMDTLSILMTGVCHSVQAVSAERVVNAATRREPLQRKVGAGLEVEEFRSLVRQGKLGHVGLLESIALIAEALGWDLEITDRIDPMIASRSYRTKYVRVKPGQATGIKHVGWGRRGKQTIVKLDLRMYVGAEGPHDAITIKGNPPLRVRVTNGVAGDEATVGVLVNAIPLLVSARPGLLTMLDLPILRCGG